MEQYTYSPEVMNNMVGQPKEYIISAIKDLTNEQETIEEIRFQLTGIKFEKNKDDKIIQVKYHDPIVNERGANEIISFFKSYLSKNISLSYFEKDEIMLRCKQFERNLTFELARNILNYGVYNRENLVKIKSILGTHFRSILGRAYQGMTLLTALKNITVSEVRNMDQEQGQQPTSVMNLFRGRR